MPIARHSFAVPAAAAALALLFGASGTPAQVAGAATASAQVAGAATASAQVAGEPKPSGRDAATFADPTRPPAALLAPPPAAASAATAASAVAAVPPRVQSVQIGRGAASALVDGRLVLVGDKVDGRTVLAIDAQGVLLRNARGGSDRLSLLDAQITKRPVDAPPTSLAGASRATPVAAMATLAEGRQP